MSRKLIIHAHPELRASIDAGEHNFFSIFRKAFEDAGVDVSTGPQSRLTGHATRFSRDYHLFQINGAVSKHALNVRQAHFYPYWSIEYANSRYKPRIAAKRFEPEMIGGVLAQVFFSQMKTRHIPERPAETGLRDFALVALQGRLTAHRSWQFADLRGMVRTIQEQDPERLIVLKPHPKEVYSDEDSALIAELAEQQNVTVANEDADALLAACAYVVTHNSALAFRGFLHRKQAILFAQTDFHHICQTVRQPDDAAKAFAKLRGEPPLFDKYLFWYLQMNCINAGRENAGEKILEMVNECGWPIGGDR